jgi:hypothetical protein
MHEIELRPGVKPEEYEQFYTNELASLPELEGWKTHLLKGDRGERAGKFLLLFEIESEEARDRYFPRPEEESEEVRRFLEQHPEAAAAWEKESTFLTDPYPRTDYIVVVEHQLQSRNAEP